jgi:hypothetical protein
MWYSNVGSFSSSLLGKSDEAVMSGSLASDGSDGSDEGFLSV